MEQVVLLVQTTAGDLQFVPSAAVQQTPFANVTHVTPVGTRVGVNVVVGEAVGAPAVGEAVAVRVALAVALSAVLVAVATGLVVVTVPAVGVGVPATMSDSSFESALSALAWS